MFAYPCVFSGGGTTVDNLHSLALRTLCKMPALENVANCRTPILRQPVK